MLLIIQILLFASFLALRARPFDQDIDLNQPASPAEESPTEIMIPTDQRTTSASETAHTQAKSKTEDQILLKNARQKKWYHKIKTQPEKYKAFLKNKADNRRMQYKNIDQSKKKELRATKRKVQAAYKERKLEKDPNFKPYDRRKELRKRVREGNATVEDLQQYEELKARHAAGQRVSAKPYVANCVSPPNSPQPIAGDVDWDSLDPLLDTSISHSLIHSPAPLDTQQGHQSLSQEHATFHIDPKASLSRATNIDMRKIPKSSGKGRMTSEEKKVRHALKQRIYRQRVKKDPIKEEAQKEKAKVRYKKWWTNLPIERADEIRERNMHTARAYRQRVAQVTPPPKKRKRTKEDKKE